MREKLMARRCGGDRGAVLVIVAVFMIVAVIMTAAVVDLGGLRQEKKEVTLSTDAAALAGASLADLEDPQLVAAGPTPVDCDLVEPDANAPNGDDFLTVQDAVDDYLGRNGGSSGLDCGVVRTGVRRGYVVVSADEIVEFAFGPAIGAASGSVAGVSVAAIQERPGGGGLRPVAVCADTSTLDGTASDVRDLILEATSTGGVLNGGLGRDLTFAVDKVNDQDGCGIATGNFGQLDLNGGSNPGACTNPDGFCWQMANGYSGSVSNPVSGDPGNNFVPSSGAIDGLIETGVRFYVPVYDAAVGSGSTASFNVTHYLETVFVGYCLLPGCRIKDAEGDPLRWFRWKVLRIANFATVGPPSATPPRLCAVDNDAGVITANCEGSDLAGGVTPLPPPPPPPSCSFSVAPVTDSVTLSNGNPKVTEQEAVFDVEFDDPDECVALTYRAYRTQGQTETFAALSADAPSGNTVRVRLPTGTPMPQGAYEVQVLEGGEVRTPVGTLTVRI